MANPVALIPETTKFESLTILLPVIDETTSLVKTVEILLRDCRDDILEIIMLVCKKTLPEAMANIEKLAAEHPQLIKIHNQTKPFVGGAFQEAFDMARGSHTVMMASDLETDPEEVVRMVAEAKAHPNCVICTSRWIRKNSFSGYNTVKLVANNIFQKIFCTLYRTRLTDMTFGYRLFPTKVIQAIQWDEFRHPFFFETIIKPIRLGVPVLEIPTGWIPRVEGDSHNSFFRNFEYFRPGFKVRFAPPQSLLKQSPTSK